ncbi:MAG: YceI family protein [Woeseiaceae bacterium]
MTDRPRSCLRLLLPAVLLIAACAQRPPAAPREVRPPTPLPEALYRAAAREGAAVYRIDPRRSLVLIQVGRAGVMRNLGHDHVIASRDLDGFVLISDDPSASRADLRMPLHTLIVDDAELRERAGLDPQVPEAAIEDTTRNMLDRVLEPHIYPPLELRAQFASVHDEPPSLSVSITLHGTAFDYLLPVRLDLAPERLIASGSMTVKHADFGLAPFTAAGGLLKVAEEIELRYELVADRWPLADP